MRTLAAQLPQIAKALAGGILGALTALGGYLTNSTSLGQVTAGQWVYVAIAFLVGTGVVYAIPNAAQKS
ncbi:MAG TPA: hypothetical protein VMH39_08950 [Gemmatimonadaceae bacterium]|nr:hypothetical protein [Gemmatimonadaceae bacterium]